VGKFFFALILGLAVLFCGVLLLAQRYPQAFGSSVPPTQGSADASITAAVAALPTRQPTGPEWPSDTAPTSASASAGEAAAVALLSFPTTYPTVSTIPTWGVPFGGVVNGIATQRKVVALTIDDGPTADTASIVDLLNRYNAHATFFWVGERITAENASYALKNGEELGNHTWNHPSMGQLNSAEASAEIGLTSARIAQFTGKPPTWFRSPYNRLYRTELGQVLGHHLLYANYNVTSVDWMESMDQTDVVSKVASTLRPGGILLMHDSPGRPPKYMPAVLELLKRNGYEIVTLSELAQMGPPVSASIRLGDEGLEW
jgi:peptidoglycan/xylan/chitin deacetylase (PgdA/CDA1 family)